MRQYGSGKKTENHSQPSWCLSPCQSQKLTGQVACGLGRKDLRHDRPRQSRFGEGGLDGPEGASPCEDKNRSSRINPTCPHSPLTARQGLQRVCFAARKLSQVETTAYPKYGEVRGQTGPQRGDVLASVMAAPPCPLRAAERVLPALPCPGDGPLRVMRVRAEPRVPLKQSAHQIRPKVPPLQWSSVPLGLLQMRRGRRKDSQQLPGSGSK